MNYFSVCAGIEAATVAWHPLGWKPIGFAEIDAFPRAVLKHHYPDVPLYGDFIDLIPNPPREAEMLVGGTPCQGFSIAGLRGSLADARSNLALGFVRLANAIDDARRDVGKSPIVICWENVPGVFSTADNAFGCFLAALVGETDPLQPTGGRWTDAGMVVGPQRRAAWRVLDAQFFGVPQRRRRVFVIASARDGFCPGEVLFERKGVQRHSPPSRETRERIAPTISARTKGGGGLGNGFDCDVGLVAKWPADVAPTLNAHFGDKQGLEDQHALNGAGLFVAHSLRADGFDASEDGTGRGTPLVPVAFVQNQRDEVRKMAVAGALASEPGMKQQTYIAFSVKDHGADAGPISPTLRAGGFDKSHANGGVMPAVAFDLRGREGGAQFEGPHDTANIRAASGGSSRSYVADMAVRRLTPMECERLQGFPDGYTDIPWRKKNWTPDGPRYKALGNSMAVPVMAHIGRRIALIDKL